MKRRLAIRNMLIAAGGVAMLPSALRAAKSDSVKLKKLKLNANQKALLAEVVETLIPATETPGAKELGLHRFVMKMLDDCHNAADQKNFVKGLGELDALAEERFKKGFAACKAKQREGLLKGLRGGKGLSASLLEFNRLLRQRTIQGYLYSEYVMTSLIPHKMIPHAYDGFYPVSKLGGNA